MKKENDEIEWLIVILLLAILVITQCSISRTTTIRIGDFKDTTK